MRSKYAIKDDDGIHFKKYTSSQIWKGVLWGAELLSRGLKWGVRNGRCVAFWTDSWLEQQPLCELSLSPISEEDMGQRVQILGRGNGMEVGLICTALTLDKPGQVSIHGTEF